MARQPRVYIEGVLYYVTSRSGHNENLFVDETDYKEYVSLVATYKKQYGFELYSYVLLPTHLHMLIQLRNSIGISRIMHDINSRYTKIYNGRYFKKGHLFQQRFQAAIAEKDTYLLQIIRHIHLNPKREKIVDDPQAYLYSSHPQFLDPAKRSHPDIAKEIEEVFGLLNGREKEFDDYVTNADPKETAELKKMLLKKRILGTSAFVSRIKSVIDESVKQQREGSLPKKTPVFYTAFGSAAIVILIIMVSYFYKQTAHLKTEYTNTMELYRNTLATLETEKESAIKANKTIENYEWKIKLTEKAIKDLEAENERKAMERKELNGYSWKVELTQMNGPKSEFNKYDTLSFGGYKITSADLSQEGFPSSNYSKSESGKNGTVTWETMQLNRKGEIANWHGEWDGKMMTGVVSRRSPDGIVKDFSFVSAGERTKLEAKQ